ncbi:MAG: STAS domain-containing protein [Chitinispirillaceae bacterium]|nr:STAS domain-containing protein [Chitinispirillaceae bacterium]
MVETLLEIKNQKAIVHVKGDATIDTIKTIHTVFVEAFNSGLPVSIDISDVLEADGSFIQLLRSLCYSLIIDRNYTVEFSGDELSPALKQTIMDTGFICRPECVRVDGIKCICNKLMNIPEFKLETME